MLLITALMEYGELRLWNCERYYYAELNLEIPADGCAMIQAKERTLEETLKSLWAELGRMRHSFSPCPQSSQ